ncbi:MAG: hypothetical protein U0Q22_14605 [Acidimicrobiales bacterium]
MPVPGHAEDLAAVDAEDLRTRIAGSSITPSARTADDAVATTVRTGEPGSIIALGRIRDNGEFLANNVVPATSPSGPEALVATTHGSTELDVSSTERSPRHDRLVEVTPPSSATRPPPAVPGAPWGLNTIFTPGVAR